MNATDQFEALVREYYEPLFRFALSLTRAESDAQDLTQHTFYVWATKGHQLRDLAKIKTWLFTTLHRAFLQARRRQARFPSHEWEEASEQLPACSPVLPDEGEAAQVLSALAELDEVYQAAVALFYLDDCSYKDIAAVLEKVLPVTLFSIKASTTKIKVPESSGKAASIRLRFIWNGKSGDNISEVFVSMLRCLSE